MDYLADWCAYFDGGPVTHACHRLCLTALWTNFVPSRKNRHGHLRHRRQGITDGPRAPRGSGRRSPSHSPRQTRRQNRSRHGPARRTRPPRSHRLHSGLRPMRDKARTHGRSQSGLPLRRTRSPELIAVDTSALMAILLDEPQAPDCIEALASSYPILVSAVTPAEALIVAQGRGTQTRMEALIDGIGLEVVPPGPAAARRVSDACSRWGRGFHCAALNFGDCSSPSNSPTAPNDRFKARAWPTGPAEKGRGVKASRQALHV